MSEFRDKMREALDAGDTPEQAYDRAVDKTPKGSLAEHFRSLGIEEARHMVRMASRRVENKLFGRGGLLVEHRETEHRVVSVREVLAATTWYANGEAINWLDATVEQHEERAAAQEQRAESLQEDASRHRQAAKVLREKGKAKLADVSDDDLEKVVE